MSKASEAATSLVRTIVQGLEHQATTAVAEARPAIQHGLELSQELLADQIAGRLNLDQLTDFLRKVGVAVETKLATIANAAAKAYVKNLISTLIGGGLQILNGLKAK